MAEQQNYTLGRGKLFFAKFDDGVYTSAPQPERYLGNSPDFSLTISETKLDHFNSDAGVKEKDASISLQVDRTGKLTTDNINTKNVALFFFGSETALVDAGGAQSDEFTAGEQGLYYQLGVSDARPAGARGLAGAADDSNSAGEAPVVFEADSNSAGTTFVVNTDYTIDLETGRLFVVEGGGIAEGTVFGVTYTVKASSYSQVISGSTAIAGQLRYVANNPQGDNIDYFFPYAKLSPDGDFSFKGDDFQKLPYSVEVLKPTGREAIYANGRKFAS